MADILNWPEGLYPSSFKWRLKSNGTSFTSPFTGSTQTVRWVGSSWRATVTMDSLDELEAIAMEALLFEMDGIAGRVKLYDFGRTPNVVRGAPLVNGANQKGTSLITDGWTASTKVLKKGDYFTVNNELKYVLADVTSNSSGQATIRFAPQLRVAPPDNAALEVAKPYAIFRLADDENGVDRKPAFDNGFSIDFVEAF